MLLHPSSLSFHQGWNSCSRNFSPSSRKISTSFDFDRCPFCGFLFCCPFDFSPCPVFVPSLCILSITSSHSHHSIVRSRKGSEKKRKCRENNTQKKRMKYLLQRLKWIAKLLSFLTTHLDHHSSNRLSRSLDFHLSYLDSHLYSDSLSSLL